MGGQRRRTDGGAGGRGVVAGLEAPSDSRDAWPVAADGPEMVDGVVVGRLVGFGGDGTTPLVTYGGQPEATAQPARSILDLHAAHLGRDILLAFERGDSRLPIVVGCLRGAADRSLPAVPGHVTVEADHQRLVVSAEQQIVLRCGKASVTLSVDGTIVLRGTHVVSHASGVNRIRGGSVQLN